ncbi:MAG: hypothetical protein FGM24_00130 [Candidatus Kapabacteria bacterium]|nr:hypothetical protein [Candidatus Kapabacteria bacterium]
MWPILMLLSATAALAQVRINEVHATPPAGEPEWVEIVNVSEVAVQLEGWHVCDARTCVKLPAHVLTAGSYVVVTRDAEALREQRVVADAAIIECPLPSLNNTSDVVVLRKADSTLVDSISYRVVVKGRSIELDDLGTWGASVARDSATCGFVNARMRMRHDLRVAEIRPSGPVPRIDVIVQQAGTIASRPRRLQLIANGTSMFTTVPELMVDEAWTWSIPLDLLPQARVVVCKATLQRGDDRSANDTIDFAVDIPPPASLVSITEVMFAPRSGQCDYAEVYNGTADTIDIDGWMLVDQSLDTVRADGHVMLPPGGYGVVATDTIVRRMMHDTARANVALVKRSFNIDAGGEDVTLLNPSGFAVDLARVDPARHVSELADTRGVALEKLEPSLVGADRASWTSSGDLAGGTPGRRNSVAIDLPPFRRGQIDVGSAWPYAIRFRHPFRHAAAFLQVATTDGAIVRTLLDNVIVGSEGSITWDGLDDAGMELPRGPYVAVFTALDATSERVVSAVATVVARGAAP